MYPRIFEEDDKLSKQACHYETNNWAHPDAEAIHVRRRCRTQRPKIMRIPFCRTQPFRLRYRCYSLFPIRVLHWRKPGNWTLVDLSTSPPITRHCVEHWTNGSKICYWHIMLLTNSHSRQYIFQFCQPSVTNNTTRGVQDVFWSSYYYCTHQCISFFLSCSN